MDILLFGMQGSGKGTQGKILAERYGLKVFDMGEELRHLIASGSALGFKLKTIVERGDLVDDDTVMEVVEAFLKTLPASQSVLFDGIPRTTAQSEKLLGLLKGNGRNAFALFIKLSRDEAIKRLSNRRVCPQCKAIYPAFYAGTDCENCHVPLVVRQDDNLDSIKRRLENYDKETLPVIKKFYEVDRLIEVDGDQPIPDVTIEMVEKAAYLFS